MTEPSPQLPHACPDMVRAIEDSRVPLKYLPRFREYGISREGGVAIQRIYFCPFCGTKLPESLREAFFDRLDALGMEIEDPALPDELRSDAWWRDGSEDVVV